MRKHTEIGWYNLVTVYDMCFDIWLVLSKNDQFDLNMWPIADGLLAIKALAPWITKAWWGLYRSQARKVGFPLEVGLEWSVSTWSRFDEMYIKCI